jgi:hypothetical protein
VCPHAARWLALQCFIRGDPRVVRYAEPIHRGRTRHGGQYRDGEAAKNPSSRPGKRRGPDQRGVAPTWALLTLPRCPFIGPKAGPKRPGNYDSGHLASCFRDRGTLGRPPLSAPPLSLRRRHRPGAAAGSVGSTAAFMRGGPSEFRLRLRAGVVLFPSVPLRASPLTSDPGSTGIMRGSHRGPRSARPLRLIKYWLKVKSPRDAMGRGMGKW